MNTTQSAPDIWSACENGDVDMVKQAIKEGGEKVVCQENGWNSMPIHIAAFHGHVEIVRLLVEAGSPVDRAGTLGTPLEEAALKGNLDLIVYLLAQGANINGSGEQQTPLIRVLRECADTEAALYLIAKGTDLYRKDATDMTAMDWAIQNDDVEVFKALVVKELVPEEMLPIDYLLTHDNAPVGLGQKILQACLTDPALGGELTEERMQQLIARAKRAEARATLLSVQTERKLQAALADGNEVGADAVAARRRNNTMSL